MQLTFRLDDDEWAGLADKYKDGIDDKQAGAIAALKDTAFIERSREVNRQGYLQLSRAFDVLRLRYVPSYGNFVVGQGG